MIKKQEGAVKKQWELMKHILKIMHSLECSSLDF